METLICEATEDGFIVKSPLVGVYSKSPQSGALINNKTCCGVITVLDEQFFLELPTKVQGVVKFNNREETKNVEYLQELFRIEKIENLTSDSEISSDAKQDKQHEKVVIAPTDGMFYRRPTPDEPAYAEIGDQVKKGQVLGLVEVMKTFNQILYSGDSLPETGKIKDILVEDGGEVKNKQILFVIE